jgi:membrane protease YdiL (CAAX protease family)
LLAVGRAVGATVGFYLAVAGLAGPALLLVPDRWATGTGGIVVTAAVVVMSVTVVYAVLVRLGWASWSMIGVPRLRVGFRALAAGAGIGALMAVGALGIAGLAGSAGLSFTGEPVTALLRAVVGLGFVLLLAALSEELLFRGYPLARLSQTVGKASGSIILAVAFALAHLWNPDVTGMGLVNIGLAALVLSAAFFTPGGLAAAWGVHWGWNAGLGLLADAPVSGIRFELPVLEFVPGGPAWLTGGGFGPEGGLAATLAMLPALVWLVRMNARSMEDHSL